MSFGLFLKAYASMDSGCTDRVTAIYASTMYAPGLTQRFFFLSAISERYNASSSTRYSTVEFSHWKTFATESGQSASRCQWKMVPVREWKVLVVDNGFKAESLNQKV